MALTEPGRAIVESDRPEEGGPTVRVEGLEIAYDLTDAEAGEALDEAIGLCAEGGEARADLLGARAFLIARGDPDR